jgi:hypothetical protein
VRGIALDLSRTSESFIGATPFLWFIPEVSLTVFAVYDSAKTNRELIAGQAFPVAAARQSC